MKQMKDYILDIFQNSNKKHIVITGSRGSGKTTLFNQIYPSLFTNACGLTSKLVDGEKVILKDDATKEETIVGKRDNGWMVCVPEGFLGLGCTALDTMIHSNHEWCSIDEIGFLEKHVEEYQNKIRTLFDTKHVLCCVRKQNLPFLEEIKNREDVFLWDADVSRMGCILMASGLSTRFGTNKLLMKYEGETFVERALKASETFPFKKRKVYTRTKELVEICKEHNVDVCLHTLDHRNEAIALAMRDMEACNACIFIPCDQPLLTKESVDKLILEAMKSNKNILRLVCVDKVGSPVIFKKEYFEMLENLPEKKGGSYIIKKFIEDVEYVEIANKMELFDVDTPEDYDRLLKWKPEF